MSPTLETKNKGKLRFSWTFWDQTLKDFPLKLVIFLISNDGGSCQEENIEFHAMKCNKSFKYKECASTIVPGTGT